MTSVPSLPEPLPAFAVGSAGEARLAVGTVVEGQVLRDLGEGRFLLRLGNARLTVESDYPLPVSQPIAARVLQSGDHLALEITALRQTGVGEISAPAAIGDQVAVSSPVTIAMAWNDMAKAAAATSAASWLALGFVFEAEVATINLPEGTAIQGYVTESPGSAAKADAQPMAPPLSAGILLAEQIYLRASIATAADTGRVVMQFPISEIGALQEALAGKAEADLNAAATLFVSSDNRPAVKLGSATGVLLSPRLFLPSDASPLLLRLEPTVWLSGSLCRASDATLAMSHPLDARIAAIGLTPTPIVREAALALLRAGVGIERQPVQALLALVAGRADSERSALLNAAARLWAQDAPLCLPLVAGAADRQDLALLYQRCDQALATAIEVLGQGTEETAMLQSARQALGEAAVDLAAWDSDERLAEFFATSGRTALARAQGFLEDACRFFLGKQPLLRNCDSAWEAILSSLALFSSHSGEDAPTAAAGQLGQAGRLAPLALPGVGRWAVEAKDTSAAQTSGNDLISRQERISEAVRAILAARDPETAADIARRFVGENAALARDLMAALQSAEEENLRQQPVVRALADAAQALNEAGRKLLAYRAESLAGLRHEPAYLAAEIPFRFQDDREDGMLRVYWRRRPPRTAAWNARVVLDLHTTRMGPVVGDMLFYGREVGLRLYTATAEIAEYLAASRDELTTALRAKGFVCAPRFAVIPQPAAADKEPLPHLSAPAQGRIDLEA